MGFNEARRQRQVTKAVQLVVRGVRRPESLGCTGQHGSQRGEGFSGPRSAEWCVRESHCSLTLLANQLGDSPVEVVEGLQDQSRLKIMDEFRKFITVDNWRLDKDLGGAPCHRAKV